MLDENTMSLVFREPIGVVGQIVPWISPSSWLPGSWPPCLPPGAAPCSSLPPYFAFRAGAGAAYCRRAAQGGVQRHHRARLPPGQFMLEHPGFRKLAFTGSTEVGRQVGLAAAKRLIPSTPELAENRPTSIFPIVSGIWAMTALQMGILFNQAGGAAPTWQVRQHETFTTSLCRSRGAFQPRQGRPAGILQPRWVRRFMNRTLKAIQLLH